MPIAWAATFQSAAGYAGRRAVINAIRLSIHATLMVVAASFMSVHAASRCVLDLQPALTQIVEQSPNTLVRPT